MFNVNSFCQQQKRENQSQKKSLPPCEIASMKENFSHKNVTLHERSNHIQVIWGAVWCVFYPIP